MASPLSNSRQKTAAPLSAALRQLQNFRWPACKLKNADELDPWDELALVENEYYRELTDTERAYEKARHQRLFALLPHLAEFRRLTELSHDFVLKAIEAGYEDTLGQRANLRANPAKSPSQLIKYEPPRLPAKSLSTSQYVSRIGGPHVFGARLLWWCAGARMPTEFGFAANLFMDLAGRPFWVEVGQAGSFHFSEWGLNRLKAAAETIASLDPAAAQNYVSRSRLPVKKKQVKDGPIEGLQFRWKGKCIRLPPTPYDYVAFLYPRRRRGVELTTLEEKFWPDTEFKQMARTHSGFRSKLNKRLQKIWPGAEAKSEGGRVYLRLP